MSIRSAWTQDTTDTHYGQCGHFGQCRLDNKQQREYCIVDSIEDQIAIDMRKLREQNDFLQHSVCILYDFV